MRRAAYGVERTSIGLADCSITKVFLMVGSKASGMSTATMMASVLAHKVATGWG